MTVHELITELQDCDMPDVEVQIGNIYVEGQLAPIASHYCSVYEVYNNEVNGPVYIVGFFQQEPK